MRAKKIVCFFTVLLLFSGLMCSADAVSDTTVSFSGAGVTIDLAFPDEAHPGESIRHNITITASTALTLHNFTVIITAPENASWQAMEQKLSSDLAENESLLIPMRFTLPQNANGTLNCFMFVQTSQSTYYSSYKFYTTRVSELTFSEMQTLYYEMLANYTSLQQDYETLLSDYNGLLADYSSLFDDYTTLLSEYDQLVADHGALLDDYDYLSVNYSSLYATYTALLSQHSQLTADYNSKVSEYDTLDDDYRVKINELGNLNALYSDLNDTYYMLQTDYGNLQIARSTLNQTYLTLKAAFDELEGRFSDSEAAVSADRVVMFIFVVTVAALIAFIVYLKRKKEEPYVVIRKETVSMKSDEES